MKSSRKIFGIIAAGCLMLATSGCVVMEPADEAEFIEAGWEEELLDDGADRGFEALDKGSGESTDPEDPEEPADPDDFPDPFGNGGGTGTGSNNSGSGQIGG